MTKECTVCGCEIPTARLAALPSTKTCVNHSTTTMFGLNIVQHGELEDDGFQEVQIVRDQATLDQLQHYRQQQYSYK